MDNVLFWSNLSQIISLIVAIVALIVSILLYRLNKQRKELSCLFENIVSPIEIKKTGALDDDIEIRYKGRTISNLLIMRVRLENTGNVPLLQSEIIEPITLRFNSNSELLRHPEIIAIQPEDLKSTWTVEKNNQTEKPNIASLDFTLLNPKDSVTTEFIWVGDNTFPKVTARIPGITRIRRFALGPSQTQPGRAKITEGIIGFIVLFAVFGIFNLFQAQLPPFISAVISAFIAFAIIYLFFRMFQGGIEFFVSGVLKEFLD